MTTASLEPAVARRFLLDQLSDDERAALEEAILEDDAAVERMAAAEDDLIEDYLGNRLTVSDRARFEESYLSVPQHRTRVDTIRMLTARARADAAARPAPSTTAPAGPGRRTGLAPWLALAASLAVIGAAVTMYRPAKESPERVDTASTTVAEAPPTAATASVPRVFALALAPVGVRGTSAASGVAIPGDAEVIRVRLDADGDARTLAPTTAIVRTVDGADVWRGAVREVTGQTPDALAEVEIPARALGPNDYVLVLRGLDRGDVEREWLHYALRIRER